MAGIPEKLVTFLKRVASGWGTTTLLRAVWEREIGSVSIDQHWKARMSGLLKLKADASVFKDYDVVGIGGIIRNSEGQVIGAIAKKLSGLFFPYAAECLAIIKGISYLLSDRG